MKTLHDTRVIFLRSMRYTLSNPAWVVLGLAQPLLYLVLFGPLLHSLSAVPGFGSGNSWRVFVPGLLIQQGILGCLYAGYGILAEARSGVLDRLKVTPASPLGLLLGRLLRDVVVLLVQAMVLVLGAYAAGLDASVGGVLVALLVVFLLGIGISAFSYGMALRIRSEEAFGSILSGITLPLMLLSGVLLPMTLAPAWLADLAKANPLSHVVTTERALFAGEPDRRHHPARRGAHRRDPAARVGVRPARPARRELRAARMPASAVRAQRPASDGHTGGHTDELHRGRLGNGLRLLVAPDRSAPVVSVAVMYDVGNRSEPEGREGFAHLFEHMMFQGSANLEKLAHARHVNACGGSFNGTTHRDHTGYYQVLPSAALELALFLEADRMRAPRFTEANLANQVAVVEQEFRRKILDNPLGGLPSPRLTEVMFDDFANAHDGWGAVERLRTVTVAECWDFFEEFYAPANALLVVCGDTDPRTVRELTERHFGTIPGGTAPPRRRGPAPDTSRPAEQRPRDDRHREHHHPGAALPVLAVGWTLPAAAGTGNGYQAALLLAKVLADGPDSVLQRNLVQRDGAASHLFTTAGLGGTPFGSRDPDVLALIAMLHAGTDPRAVLDTVHRELDLLAARGPDPELLARCAATWATSWARALDPLGTRVQRLGAFELLHGRAELARELPARVRGTTVAEVAEAAAALAGQPRRWVTVLPEAADRPTGADR
ncbi:ABC transporter permease [Streptacidiphilus sp. PAMC 29251]